MRSILVCLLVSIGLLVGAAAVKSEPVTAGSLDVRWNPGATDCAKTPQPPIQVHAYNATTFILRENPCITPEAPFMYLLVGQDKALLIDTGDVADAKVAPLARTVAALLPGEGAGKRPLVVVHTHSHLDHRRGDAQFASVPYVQVVGADLASVKAFFGFSHWPDGVAQVQLGDRIVDVLPTPGHTPNHVSFYDRQTGLFFSGDFFLPGRLLIDDAAADRASAARVAAFLKDRPVTAVLGGHVELTTDGQMGDLGSTYRRSEHGLALSKADILAAPEVIGSFNGVFGVHGVYVMYNQTWVLGALAVAALAVLGFLIWFVVWLIRRLTRRRRPWTPARLARAPFSGFG